MSKEASRMKFHRGFLPRFCHFMLTFPLLIKGRSELLKKWPKISHGSCEAQTIAAAFLDAQRAVEQSP